MLAQRLTHNAAPLVAQVIAAVQKYLGLLALNVMAVAVFVVWPNLCICSWQVIAERWPS